MQMPTITERQSGRKLTSEDMAAGSLLLLFILFFFLFASFSRRGRSEESGANKRLRLYKLRETDDGAAAREDEFVLRSTDSRRTGPSNVI